MYGCLHSTESRTLVLYTSVVSSIKDRIYMVRSSIGGTRNTRCAIWCLEIKAFFDYKLLHDGWKTIVTTGDLDNINKRVFKLPRLANFNLHKNLT